MNINQVSERLNINPETLRKWDKQLKEQLQAEKNKPWYKKLFR